MNGGSTVLDIEDGHVKENGNGRLQHDGNAQKGVTLEFNDVCVTLNKNNILKKVYGMATVGQMLAVMGPSGAGKSTLLNTLTGRTPFTSGYVTLNGVPVNRHIRRKISYVMQQDVFYPTLTLRETLMFQVMLRLPSSMPEHLKVARMMEIVTALELNKCLDTKIGSAFVTGLSGGEKKRASIACELLTNPKLLILDEPTSGLDSAIAFSLMSSLDKYSKLAHKTVVTTIHQPSSQIFHMFTNVLLLQDGKVAYFGPGSRILEFFANVGMICEPNYNPADFILEKVKTGPENVRKLVDASSSLRSRDGWGNAPDDQQITIVIDSPRSYADAEVRVVPDGVTRVKWDTEVANDSALSNGAIKLHSIRKKHDNSAGDNDDQHYHHHDEVDVESFMDYEKKWQTGFLSQYLTLTKRNFLRQKQRYFSYLNFGPVLVTAVFAGLVWFQLERTEETAKDRLGLLFFTCVNFGFTPAIDGIHALPDNTGVFMRERSSGLYRLSAYFLAVMTTETPVMFILETLYVIIVYWMTNLTPAAVNFVCYWFMLLLSTYTAQSIGMLIGVIITTQPLVMLFTNTFMILTLLAAGFYNSHIAGWFVWIRYLSYMTYSLNALAYIEFTDGHPLSCNPETTLFPTQCTANSTTIPGEAFVSTLGVDNTSLAVNIVVLFAVLIFCRVAAYVILRFFRRPRT